ncbi:flagellar basal body L-ring protein FlgH [Buchnera aphidicola (Melanaphis sacchari)]|uniref:Flagellar L-ring protein n=1 Tax=Buchnera aphidicola (Melanaphis sacchari) TaxID=2173854 RepID=A0A2U8DG20_9GAMM|nr:flagellar basal body L-ring protein FlgH [Buchnera aphidicola]AWH90451.1 flagellar basal body L-ring protein FlgH [Buchnera aphidicola (Melanaphis sacchari)]
MVKLFIHKIKYHLTVLFLLALQSCASIEHKPLINGITTAMAPNTWPNTINGSLFQENTPVNYGYQSLFEDHKPRNVGDTITIVLQESISASNSSSSDLSRDSTSNVGVTIIPGQLMPLFGPNNGGKTGLDNIGKNDFIGKGSNSAKNTFNGLISVTVQKVLPNGNLKVIGEKQVSINEGIEFIRFSGVINPNNINKNNLIASTQIADARIEYISSGRINEIQKMGWLQRLLLKISPI